MKLFPALFLLALLWAMPAGAAPQFLGPSEADQQPPPPAPASYHPDDVEVVDKLLQANDRRGHLRARGWEAGRPETWSIHIPHPRPSAGVRWNDEGRLTALFLPKCNLLGSLNVGGLSALELLWLENNPDLEGIEGLESCAELVELNASLTLPPLLPWPPGDDDFSKLTEISGLSRLKKLRILNLSRNRLTSLGDLSGLTQLTELNLSDNQLADLGDLGGLTQLTKVNLAGNRLTDIGDLSGLTQLTELILAGNQLSDIGDLGGLTRLVELAVNNNRLAGLGDLGGLTQLARLSVSNNQLTDLGDLGGLTELGSLNAADNRLTSLSLPQPGRFGLMVLDITNNRLTGLQGLSRHGRLGYLSLGGNPLLDFDFLPGADSDQSPSSESLASSDQLYSFGFSGDQWPEFSLARGFKQLKSLRVGGGAELRSVDLAGRPLERIELADRISADKFNQPGRIEKVLILGDFHYRLAELMALADKFGAPLRSPWLELSPKPRRVDDYNYVYAPVAAQTLTLGDAAAGLAAGRAYLPAELSPVLGGEFAAGGPEMLLHLFPADQDRSGLVTYLRKFRPKSRDRSRIGDDSPGSGPAIEDAFLNGRLTFPAPGRYRLSASVRPRGDDDYPLTVHYEDIFTAE